MTIVAGSGDLVLLTGISGFIAKHVAAELLFAGDRVRGTVRSAAKAAGVRATLAAAGCDVSRLEIVEADLERGAGWEAAAAGCRFVQHTASPFPASVPRDRNALVPAAVGGTLRVLAAARHACAERVVVTSSVAAVQYGHVGRHVLHFTETDFSDVDSHAIMPYAISKTLAEKAAWNAAGDAGLSLATVNPGVVFGPLMDAAAGTSASLVAMMMKGRLPLVPNMSFAVVDVRDVAAAHVAAMRLPAADGRRFFLSAGTRSMREIADAVAAAVPAYRGKMPRASMPDALVRAAAVFFPPLRLVVPELGSRKSFDTGPAESILGIRFRTPEMAAAAMAESLVQHRLV